MFACFCFAYGNNKQTRSLFLLDLYLKDTRRAISGCIIDLIYGQSILFKPFDCRSEGVVPANTYIEKVS